MLLDTFQPNVKLIAVQNLVKIPTLCTDKETDQVIHKKLQLIWAMLMPLVPTCKTVGSKCGGNCSVRIKRRNMNVSHLSHYCSAGFGHVMGARAPCATSVSSFAFSLATSVPSFATIGGI